MSADVSEPPADRLLAGTPELQVRNFFTDPSQQFFAGRWSATRGKWRVRYTENELCVMTAGRVVIESASGERSVFGPGDAFVIPAGFVMLALQGFSEAVKRIAALRGETTIDAKYERPTQ